MSTSAVWRQLLCGNSTYILFIYTPPLFLKDLRLLSIKGIIRLRKQTHKIKTRQKRELKCANCKGLF